MSFIYICNLNTFKKWMTKDYEWFGLYNSKSISVLYELIPYVIIIFFAFLTRISSSFKNFYFENAKEEIKDKEYKSASEQSSESITSIIKSYIESEHNIITTILILLISYFLFFILLPSFSSLLKL